MKKYVNGTFHWTSDEIKIRQAEEKAWADGQADRNMMLTVCVAQTLFSTVDYSNGCCNENLAKNYETLQTMLLLDDVTLSYQAVRINK